MVKRKTLLGLAFAGLAALSIVSGYSSQSKAKVPPRKTAYSYTAGNNGTIRGKVGTQSSGLEYMVTDLPSPKASVAAKLDESMFARMDYDRQKRRTGFYAEKQLSEKSSIRGSAYYASGTQKANVRYEKAFDSWLNNVAFSYTESLGRKKKSYAAADIGLSLFGKKLSFSVGYDLLGKGFDIKNFRYA